MRYSSSQSLQKDEDFFLIDVREDREWIQGHILGAHHLGKGIIERYSNLINNKESLLFYIARRI